MLSNRFEVVRSVPKSFQNVKNELPGMEAEKEYVFSQPIEPMAVIVGVTDCLAQDRPDLFVLPYLIQKETLVNAFEGGGVKFSIREDVHKKSVTVVSKGKKILVPSLDGTNDVVVIRPEIKILVPDGMKPLEVVQQNLFAGKDPQPGLISTDVFYRNKITAVVVDDKYRAYALNVSNRQRADNDELGGQLEVEYLGSLRKHTERFPQRAICQGILRVSRTVSVACDLLNYQLTPKHQIRGFSEARRFQ